MKKFWSRFSRFENQREYEDEKLFLLPGKR